MLSKKRHGLFQIGSKIIVLNEHNLLTKLPYKIGYIKSYVINENGFSVVAIVQSSIFTDKVFIEQTYDFNGIYHSIKDFAKHNKDYLIGRIKEYENLLHNANVTIEPKTKNIYKRIEKQIIHILEKSNLADSLYCC